MAKGKYKNSEPMKMGVQVYCGTIAFVNAAIAFQSGLPDRPLDAPPVGSSAGTYQGAGADTKSNLMGPGIDATTVNNPGPLHIDPITNETRYVWPEAIYPGKATGFHFQGQLSFANTAESGKLPPQFGPTPFTLPAGQIAQAQVTVVAYRLQAAYRQLTMAGDMQNRFSPFLYPQQEILFSNVGIIERVGGSVLAGEGFVGVNTGHGHSFSGRVKSSRELKTDDGIAIVVRVRSTFGSSMLEPPVVGAIDMTGFYLN